MQLPEKILALRKARNMSQEDLATALGVTRQTVSRWEVGSALPDAEKTEFGFHVLPDAQGGAGPLFFSLIYKNEMD